MLFADGARIIAEFIKRLDDRMSDETSLPIDARFEVLEIAKRELAMILSEDKDKSRADAFAQGALDSMTPTRGMTGPFVQSAQESSYETREHAGEEIRGFGRRTTSGLRQNRELPIIDAEVIED